MKPIEITKEQYETERKILWNKARKMAPIIGSWVDPRRFYSFQTTNEGYYGQEEGQAVCNLREWEDKKAQAKYKKLKKRGVERLTHFMESECNSACPKSETTCYAKVGNRNNGYKYYRTDHIVGQCPWKE